jgi:hypothetical protein
MKSAAEPGTIVGPNAFDEMLVARSCTHEQYLFVELERRRDFWTATAEEVNAVKHPEHSPRSLVEIKLQNRRVR